MDSFFSLIFGAKTQAFFDVWSIEHLLSGLSVGHAVRRNNHSLFEKKIGIESHRVSTIHFDIVGVLFLAFAWEALEHYLEVGLAGVTVEFWFQGVEFWGNRLVADPFMMVIGYLIAKRNPQLVVPARVLSLAWLVIHIFVFPHSMYLNHILGFQ